MKKLLLILTIAPLLTFSQKVSKRLHTLNNSGIPFKLQTATTVANEDKLPKVTKFKSFKIDNRKINKESPKYLKLKIPDNTVLLERVDDQTRVITSTGIRVPNKTTSYRGSIEGDSTAIAAFTFSDTEETGSIRGQKGSFIISKSKKNHIIFNEADASPEKQLPSCGTTDKMLSAKLPTPNKRMGASLTTDRCVQWYYETDYDVYIDNGSSTDRVNTFIQGAFNLVATIYANEGISIKLKTLFIWTTPDPYVGTSTGNYVTQFGNYRGSNFDGDLAHLVNTRGGGGVAYINQLGLYQYGGKSPAGGYSGVYNNYSSNISTYSWTINCLAHEMGHQMGSHHTHACMWNGNGTKIDDCGGSRGYSSGICPPIPDPILPVGGGTIMSYCYLTSVGTKLVLGPQVSQRIIECINAAKSALAICGTIQPPNPACADSIQTRNRSCSTGYVGLISEKRTYSCTTKAWGNWAATSNTCTTPPTTTCPNPYIITASISQRLNDVIVIRSGFTNYNYKWWKNGIPQTWTGQTVAKSLYKSGDILKVTVGSVGAQTATKCWETADASITIK